MRIFHFSDRPVTNFMEMYAGADVLIATGDLTVFDFGNLQDLQPKKVAFGVYGNHDSGEYLEQLGIINLHNTVYDWHGLRWGGFQGCLRYKKGGGPQFSEEEAEQWQAHFPAVDVLVLHAGPKGLLDDPTDDVHIGSEAVRRYVLQKKPKYVFCGHQYSNEDLQADGVQLYRTYGGRWIDLLV